MNFIRDHLACFYSLSQQLLSVCEFLVPFEDKVCQNKKYSVVYRMHLLHVVWLLKLQNAVEQFVSGIFEPKAFETYAYATFTRKLC